MPVTIHGRLELADPVDRNWLLTEATIDAEGSSVHSYQPPAGTSASVCPEWCESAHTADFEHHFLSELAKSGEASVDMVQDDVEQASPTAVIFWRGQTVIPHLTRDICRDLLELLPQLGPGDVRDIISVMTSAEAWLTHEHDKILPDRPSGGASAAGRMSGRGRRAPDQ